jgi:hypothetical protein
LQQVLDHAGRRDHVAGSHQARRHRIELFHAAHEDSASVLGLRGLRGWTLELEAPGVPSVLARHVQKLPVEASQVEDAARPSGEPFDVAVDLLVHAPPFDCEEGIVVAGVRPHPVVLGEHFAARERVEARQPAAPTGHEVVTLLAEAVSPFGSRARGASRDCSIVSALHASHPGGHYRQQVPPGA